MKTATEIVKPNPYGQMHVWCEKHQAHMNSKTHPAMIAAFIAGTSLPAGVLPHCCRSARACSPLLS